MILFYIVLLRQGTFSRESVRLCYNELVFRLLVLSQYFFNLLFRQSVYLVVYGSGIPSSVHSYKSPFFFR